MSGNKGDDSDLESWMNKDGAQMLSNCSSEDDTVVMPLQLNQNTLTLNKMIDSLGLS